MTHLQIVERMYDLCPALTFHDCSSLTRRLIQAGYLTPEPPKPSIATCEAKRQRRSKQRAVSRRALREFKATLRQLPLFVLQDSL